MYTRHVLLLFVVAIQQCIAADSVDVSAAAAAASIIAKKNQNFISRSLEWCAVALNTNKDTIAVISLAFGSLSVSIVAVIQSLGVFFQTRAEIQQLRHDLEMQRQKLKTVEDSRASDIQAIEDKRALELKAIEERRVSELQAERALRASEVSLARSEAVKEILLLGGKEYYAQILMQILANQSKGNRNKQDSD
jgi:hypothetical protein